MSNESAVRIGVAGLGGYATIISDLILQNGAGTSPRAELAAACDPELSAHPERVATLQDHGVKLYGSYEEMLTHPGLEAVWLPVPIDLHVPFAEQALAAGLGVMLEKPVAGTIDELDRLIAARDAAGRPLLVGFQDIYDDQILPLKQTLLSGNLGRITGATVWGCWPRGADYFGRATWAGAMKRGDTWVLDSPLNNAMAHFANLALFLVGDETTRSAKPLRLEAELYRAADIENYDTASIRVTLDGPEPFDLLILLTHAVADTIQPLTHIRGERGEVRYDGGRIAITRDGDTQTIQRTGQMRREMLESFVQTMRDPHADQHARATLEVARVHTMIVNAASQVARITPVPREFIEPAPNGTGTVQSVPGLEAVFKHCATHGQMLHESGQLPFTVPATTIDLADYRHFTGPASAVSV